LSQELSETQDSDKEVCQDQRQRTRLIAREVPKTPIYTIMKVPKNPIYIIMKVPKTPIYTIMKVPKVYGTFYGSF
jgi:hypothetical protein